jgi:adenylate kinase
MKNIIIFGPPGAGKGTMSNKLLKDFNLRHISTGDIIRKNQEEKTKIGILADKIVNQGGLLPDDIVNEMIKQEIIDAGDCDGFLFDGFPRTSGQARMLDEFLYKRKTPVNAVVYLETPKHVVQDRIIARGATSGRKDDNFESFQNRWAAYQSETMPCLEYFNGRGKVHTVDGTAEIESVYSEVKKVVEGVQG